MFCIKKNKKTLLIYPAGRTQKSYTIQGKTTQIGEAAFEYAKYLQKISYGKNYFIFQTVHFLPLV